MTEHAQTREQRQEIVPRPHLGVAPLERLGNLDEGTKPRRGVARDDGLGADRGVSDAPVGALEGVAPVDAPAGLLRLVGRRDQLPAIGALVDPAVQHLLRQPPAGVGAHRRPHVRFGELALEPDDAAVGREIDARFPRIAGHEGADGPGERRDVVASDQSVEGIKPSAGQLDEGAEGVVALKPDGGAGAGGGERVRVKERVGPSERDVAGERLLEGDDRKGAGIQPGGDRHGSEGDPGNDGGSP